MSGKGRHRGGEACRHVIPSIEGVCVEAIVADVACEVAWLERACVEGACEVACMDVACDGVACIERG